MSKSGAKSIEVFNANTDELFNSVFIIRTEVFVDESKVDQEDEYDGFDHLSQHYLATYEGSPAGASRWRILPASQRVRLERIAVLKDYRRKGVGAALVAKMLEDIPKDAHVFGHAQAENQAFFKSLGFVAVGGEFEEAGIPHVEMQLQKKESSK
ncbi:MAG: GNAT family N-acetyltransferase [Bacteroidota bacterium]